MDRSSEWETLYRQFAPAGLRYAYSILRDHAEAEEATHDAFCRLLASSKWRGMDRDQDGFGAVLFTTIRRRAIDILRHRSRMRGYQSRETADMEMSDAPTRFEEDHLQRVIHDLIDQLPTSWRDALQMRAIGGLSYREIARALDCTPAQVRTWLYRARQQLAEQLRHRGLFRTIGSNHE